MTDKLKKEICELMDSFLVEAKNQYGEDRSVKQLNQDRHLFVENMVKIIDRVREEEREELTHLLIQSMPKDAENLSTLTDWQARETIQNFLDKLNKK